ncbi:hypothetical protein [Nocardia yamanashiensis]|uniref:hypothetical protein n=1 Tax=Nocardia yamanashiensis TaxID=209247 RepID=UPI0008363B74|nr:hypothetical protein [Nocardia yamanashiensis]
MATPLILPSVVGFICPGTPGADWEKDSAEIHSVAIKLGCVVAAIVYDIPGRYLPFGRITSTAWSADSIAVIVPNDRHLSAGEVDDLLAVGDVIFIESAKRHTAIGREVKVTDLWNSGPVGTSSTDR